MTGLRTMTTQIIDDAKASAQKAKAAAEAEASNILAAAKTQREKQITQIELDSPGTDGGNCRPSSIQCRT